MLHPPAKRGAIAAQAGHLAEADVAFRAVEFLAEQVGDERVVTELDQLPPEADLELGHAHHRRHQDDRRPRLAVAAPDEHAFQALAFELMRDGAFLAHAASSNFSAWARASSVIDAPDSMRAISSRRSLSSSFRTVVRVPSSAVALFDPVMVRSPRGDLGRMGDDQHLRLPRQPRQPLADRAGNRAADAAVDLVEDHRRRVPRLGKRDLEREDEARQLAPAGDPGQRSERRTGVGRDFELDPVDARRPGLGGGDRGAEAGGVELQREARRRPRRRA